MKEFEEPLQIIAPDGTYRSDLDPNLEEDALLNLYRMMVLTRTVDTTSVILQRQGRIGFYVPSTGEEAAQIGSAYALEPSDLIVAAYREPGAAFLRGMPVERLYHQACGNAKDVLKGRQMPSHFGDGSVNFVPASSPVGTQIPIAVGAAWASKMKKDGRVTLVYFGDGATSQGDFHTGMNFAGVYQVPIVLFCKNNQWAISCPFSKQTASGSIHIKAMAYGFEGRRVDGNDVLAVYVATQQAVAKARRGEGPTLLEVLTYRIGPHSTSDDPRRYRDQAEVDLWKQKDPIDRFRIYLEQKGLWCKEDDERLCAEAEAHAKEAFDIAENTPMPPVESLFEDVYETPTWNLKEQDEYARLKVGQT